MSGETVQIWNTIQQLIDRSTSKLFSRKEVTDFSGSTVTVKTIAPEGDATRYDEGVPVLRPGPVMPGDRALVLHALGGQIVLGALGGESAATLQPPRIAYLQTSRHGTSATATPITDLDISIGAGEVWRLSYSLRTGYNATTGFRVSFVNDSGSGATGEYVVTGFGDSAHEQSSNINAAAGGISGAYFNRANWQYGWLQATGVVVGGDTGGTVQICLLSGIEGEQWTVYRFGSVRAEQIA